MASRDLISSVTVEEQRVFIKFGVILNRDSGQIQRDLVKALGKNALKPSTVRKWDFEFRN
jgi:hypothetical protein